MHRNLRISQLVLVALVSLPHARVGASGSKTTAELQRRDATTLHDKAKVLREVCDESITTGALDSLKPLVAALEKVGAAVDDAHSDALASAARALADENGTTRLRGEGSAEGAVKTPTAAVQALKALEAALEALREASAQGGATPSKPMTRRLEQAERAVREANGAASLCRVYCSNSFINLCEFADDVKLATVASSVDHEAVRQVLKAIKDAEDRVAEEREEERGGGAVGSLFGALGVTGTMESASELALRFAVGLGKLALDRAKQEAVVWALEQIGARACGHPTSGAKALTKELSTYWLPQLCTLTANSNLTSGFGAGEAMLAAFVSAVEDDAKGLPGAAAGLVVGGAYWFEDQGAQSSLFECGVTESGERGQEKTAEEEEEKEEKEKACARVVPVRTATSSAIRGLLDGADPATQARTWAAKLDDINRVKSHDSDDHAHGLVAPWMQLAACGLSVAADLRDEGPVRAIDDLPVEYRVLATLSGAPACWTLTGEGWPSAENRCQERKDEPPCAVKVLALDRETPGDVERLSTVLRLASLLHRNRQRLAFTWGALRRVDARLSAARKRLKSAITDAKGDSALRLDVLGTVAKIRVAEFDRDTLRELVDEVKLDAAKERLTSALDVAEEIVAAADAFAAVVEDINQPQQLWPGLKQRRGTGVEVPGWACGDAELRDGVRDFRAALGSIGEVIDALRDALAGDWTGALMRGIAVAQQAKVGDAGACAVGGSSAAGEKTHEEVIKQLSEFVGIFAALLSAEDSDDFAEILEKTASPPGGWRRKQARYAFTVSIAAHVGLLTAAEFRYGQYGVNYERGATHWQRPTLSVPIGFDFAWGVGRRQNSLGFFVPVIDPAAFLQYDTAEGGRLPGPRPLTVLAPGALFRWGIFRTPITLLAGYVYRPRLRTWEATVNEPGADAHQVVFSLAVDATLWNIVKR